MELRDYQKKTIDYIKSNIGSIEELIVKLPTGAGKTFLIARLAKELKELGFNVLVTSDVMQLIYQLEEHFQNINENVSKIVSNERSSVLSAITLASEQTLVNRLKELNKVDNLVLIYDEAHKRRFGDRFKTIVDFLKPKKLIGFTATPYNLKDFEVFTPVTIVDLYEQGYLQKVDYRAIDPRVELEKYLKDNGSDFTADSVYEAYNHESFKEFFVKEFLREIEIQSRQTLLFVSNIKMADWIYELINESFKELNIGIFHSQNNDQEVINKFKSKEIQMLIGVTSLTIGFDAPNADTVINLRPTKSLSLFHQIIGRIMRIDPSKSKAEFFDLADNLSRHIVPEITDFVETETNEWSAIKIQKTLGSFDYKDVDERLSYLKLITKNELKEIENKYIKFVLDHTYHVYKLLDVANEINYRFYGFYLRENTMVLMQKNLLDLINEFPHKERSIIDAYRTRIKNIFKNKKKLASLIYFADFMRKSINERYYF